MKFNNSAKGTMSQVATPDTTNLAYGNAYLRDDSLSEDKKGIASVIMNAILRGDNYYKSAETTVNEIFNTVKKYKNNPAMLKFLAQAMIYVRTEGALRTVSHVLAVALAENAKGTNFLRTALNKAILRPDDMAEMFALWSKRNEPMSNSLRRAFKDSLETKWDGYALKKYSLETSEVKLKDIIKLARPNPKNLEDKNLFKKVIEGTLPNIVTAQTINAASTGEDRAQNYKEALQNKQLGFMAAVKNIKNILETNPDKETVELLCSLLRNERAIKQAKVLPFRYLDAYKVIKGLGVDRITLQRVICALEEGFVISSGNLEIFPEDSRVAILLDESGSMTSEGNGKAFEYGSTLTASLLATVNGRERSNFIGYLWANSCREVNLLGSPFEVLNRLQANGGGTYIDKPLKRLLETKTNVDYIVIFTDMMLYGYNSPAYTVDTYVAQYRKEVNPNVKVIWWNLSTYSQECLPSKMKNSFEVCGFSDKLLPVLAGMLGTGDANYLIKEIEKISL